MGLMDKVKGLLGQHGDKAKGAVDKAGDAIDQRTGGKHADKVDDAQRKAQEFIDKQKGDQA